MECVFCSEPSEARLCSDCDSCTEYMLRRGVPVTRLPDGVFWVVKNVDVAKPTDAS